MWNDWTRGAWLYGTECAPRRQQFHVAPAMSTIQRCKYTTSVDIQKRAMKSYTASLIHWDWIVHKSVLRARKRRIALSIKRPTTKTTSTDFLIDFFYFCKSRSLRGYHLSRDLEQSRPLRSGYHIQVGAALHRSDQAILARFYNGAARWGVSYLHLSWIRASVCRPEDDVAPRSMATHLRQKRIIVTMFRLNCKYVHIIVNICHLTHTGNGILASTTTTTWLYLFQHSY